MGFVQFEASDGYFVGDDCVGVLSLVQKLAQGQPGMNPYFAHLPVDVFCRFVRAMLDPLGVVAASVADVAVSLDGVLTYFIGSRVSDSAFHVTLMVAPGGHYYSVPEVCDAVRSLNQLVPIDCLFPVEAAEVASVTLLTILGVPGSQMPEREAVLRVSRLAALSGASHLATTPAAVCAQVVNALGAGQHLSVMFYPQMEEGARVAAIGAALGRRGTAMPLTVGQAGVGGLAVQAAEISSTLASMPAVLVSQLEYLRMAAQSFSAREAGAVGSLEFLVSVECWIAGRFPFQLRAAPAEIAAPLGTVMESVGGAPAELVIPVSTSVTGLSRLQRLPRSSHPGAVALESLLERTASGWAALSANQRVFVLDTAEARRSYVEVVLAFRRGQLVTDFLPKFLDHVGRTAVAMGVKSSLAVAGGGAGDFCAGLPTGMSAALADLSLGDLAQAQTGVDGYFSVLAGFLDKLRLYRTSEEVGRVLERCQRVLTDEARAVLAVPLKWTQVLVTVRAEAEQAVKEYVEFSRSNMFALRQDMTRARVTSPVAIAPAPASVPAPPAAAGRAAGGKGGGVGQGDAVAKKSRPGLLSHEELRMVASKPEYRDLGGASPCFGFLLGSCRHVLDGDNRHEIFTRARAGGDPRPFLVHHNKIPALEQEVEDLQKSKSM